MQPKQIQPKQMQSRQIQSKQMQPKQFTRQHNDHQHSMTIASPRQDSRQMFIPPGTIVEEPPNKIRFGYLRSWIMSLLALIALPVGVIFILIGTEIVDGLATDWIKTEATVVFADDGLTEYIYNVNGASQSGSISRSLDAFFSPKSSGELLTRVSLCDIASVFVIPGERQKAFSVWFDPQSPARHQCVPMNSNAGRGFVIGGWILVVLSVLTFIRVFHRAAIQLSK